MEGSRRLGVLPMLGIVAVYLAILLFVPMLTTEALDGFSYGVFPDAETVLYALIIPVGLSVGFTLALLVGVSHATNIFTEDNSAIPQVLVTTAAGFFFYLVRRVSGGIVLPIVLHGLRDFGLFSGGVTDEAYAGTFLFILADLVMGAVLLVGRRRIEPAVTLA